MIKLNTWKAAKKVYVLGASIPSKVRPLLLKVGFCASTTKHWPSIEYGTAYASGQ
ncbi:hypothetical protein MADE_1014685 [Alteromonas mediterranea DE]|uniref:Uncharacterized protein n=1 Tax=Alteromonas mediterranea (strain DSM 17117 / CIP 110805 / LMG 28347 / Deep ecotype) TaxID=1774373 RepID=F2GCB5_ALTMD|nr:hypothetical protein MADE_1014685 [Alteromonas mediterranea DE]